ncbi:MFS transporter [Jiangella ureilytica]|uniref:MFS transporter n=1 Tax=Jiangella ureilytica TaxID=2530374 RepID=A0A4R4S3K5_9ACTN|nr:Cmx/CmrA family chloramphenicol efflux MFS transporter [Jiangella ureilytica]TDC56886.1 MFS transporter [Jiangella ureilytica]
MPAVVHLLALAVFAQGTSEFMLAGLVPEIAAGLSVSVPAAGSLTSAYAVGMVVGALAMALLSRRWSPRTALLAFLTAFLLAHVVAATTGSYAVLVATRVAAALANAGFLAVALTAAAALAGPRNTGRATSVLLSGVTVACVAGVPGGALLGQHWGWRAPFWAVALLCVPALLAIRRSVPRRPTDGGLTAAAARAELAVLRRPRLRLILLLGALVNAATFGAFTYLAPVVTDAADLGEGWVPPVLALFGLGAFAGVTIGGRLADRPGLRRPLTLVSTALLAGWVLLALLAHVPAVVVLGAGVQGTLSFAAGSALIARSIAAATGAPRLAGAYATAAMNVGAAAGPLLAGAALSTGAGYRSPLWVSAALVAAAAVVAGLATLSPRRGARRR